MTDGVLEEDRYLVLLSCGHWTQTRRPFDRTYPCPYDGGDPEPARTSDGQCAVLSLWELVAKCPNPTCDVPWHGHVPLDPPENARKAVE